MIDLEAWDALGFAGQALFSGRILVQWVASERRRESVVPVLFWWLSVSGSALLAVYSAVLRDPAFLLGNLVNGSLYVRNLLMARSPGGRPVRRRVLVPVALGLLLFLAVAGWRRADAEIPPGLLVLGFVGTVVWSSRFVLQWYASERAGRSHLPPVFWWVGLAGSLLMLAYSVLRREPVFILGFAFVPVPYARNLLLLRRAGRRTP